MIINTYITSKLILACFLISTIYSPLSIYAQDQTAKIEFIKASEDYYWGEATSNNITEAEDKALARLTQMISVYVKSSFERNISETGTNIEETVESILKTYSTASLKNVETIRQRVGNSLFVFRYINKEEVQKIFDERKKLVKYMFEQAIEYEENNNFGYAIKLFYFANILVKSIPEINVIFNDTNFTTEIPNRINNILNNTTFQLIEDKILNNSERILEFRVNVFDKPASYLEFNFWDGTNSINVRAKDGIGIVKLFGSSINFDRLDINVKYDYYECRDEIDEVAALWNLVKKAKFKNNQNIPLKKKVVIKQVENLTSANEIISNFTEGNFKLEVVDTNGCEVLNQIGKETLILLELLERKDILKIQQYYNYDPYLANKLKSILHYNNINIIEKLVNVRINKTYNGWELRKIGVLNVYNSLRKQTTEHLVLDFDNLGKLIDVTFGITDALYNTFVDKSKYGNDWGNRQVIIKFVEKYRTAFLTRDISVLNSVFSEEAIIIVGRILKKRKLPDSFKYSQISDAQPTYEQIRYTKQEYLERQKKIFDTRKDIFLGFSTFNINRKNKQEGVYGLSMRQHYNSTGYSDEGYLFLLIDFNDELPQIYVRSWQPQEWDSQSLIKLANFNINK